MIISTKLKSSSSVVDNYILAKIASEHSQMQVESEDIDSMFDHEKTVVITFLDKEGEKYSTSLDKLVFDQKVSEYELTEKIERAAEKLIRNKFDLEITVRKTYLPNREQKVGHHTIEFIINDIFVDSNSETGKAELIYSNPVASIGLDLTFDYWIVAEYLDPTSPIYSFYLDRDEAIEYFRSAFHAFQSKYSIGKLVIFQSEWWRIERLVDRSIYQLERFDYNSHSWLEAIALEDELTEIISDREPF